MVSRWLALGVALTVLSWCARPALAQPDAEAHGLYEAGAAAFADGRFDEALTYFQRAYERSPRAALLYNIGQAADRARRDEIALDAFRRYLAEGPETAHVAEIEGRIRVLERTIAERAERDAALAADEERAREVEASAHEEVAVDVAPEAVAPELGAAAVDASSASDPPRGSNDVAPVVALSITSGVLGIAGAIVMGVGIPDLEPPRPGAIYAREVDRQVQAEALTISGAAALGLAIVGAVVAGVIATSADASDAPAVRVDARGFTVAF